MNKLRLPVDEFTTPNPVTATENTRIDELVRLMQENGIRHLPIIRGERVVGIISDRDLRVATCLTAQEKSHVHARDIMVTNPVTVSFDESLDDVAFKMSKNKIGSVIVNDEDDKFLGLFTATDALNALIEIIRSGQTPD